MTIIESKFALFLAVGLAQNIAASSRKTIRFCESLSSQSFFNINVMSKVQDGCLSREPVTCFLAVASRSSANLDFRVRRTQETFNDHARHEVLVNFIRRWHELEIIVQPRNGYIENSYS